MNTLLADPVVQTVLPLAFALFGVGLFAFFRRGLASAGVGLAFVLAYVVIVGVPAFPPPSSLGKLFWAAVAGLALGIGADVAGLAARKATVLVGIWLAGALGWMVLPSLSGGTGWLTLGLVALAGVAGLSRGARARQSVVAPAAMLLSGALAVGGTALIGSSASIAQLAFGLAAATGGLLLWNWPVERHAWGAAGQAAFGILVLLAAALAFFTNARAEVLLAALPALLADRLALRLPLPESRLGGALATVAVSVVAAVPAVAAVGLAFALSGGEASGY